MITQAADLSITKTAQNVVAGDQVTYTITASNPGPSDAVNATVTDTFPGSLSNVSWTCVAGATSSCAAGNNGNINEMVTIAAGESVVFTATGNLASDAMGDLVNTAMLAAPGGFTDSNLVNNSATDTTTIAKEANLNITKTDNPNDPVVAGGGAGNLTYTITVTNTGPSDASAVVVTDTLPTDVSLPMTSGCTGDPNAVADCPLGAIAAGAFKEYTIQVTVDPSATALNNTASVAGAETDPDTNDNTVMEGTTVNIEADISVSKIGPANFAIGGSDDYVVTISNTTGPSDATAQLVDTLPPGFTFNAGMSTTPTTCAQLLQVVTCDAVTVPVGGMAVYTLNVTVNSGTPNTMVTNTAVANLTVGTDSDLNNNTSPFMSLLVNTPPVIGTPMAAVQTIGNTRLAATGAPAPAALTAADTPADTPIEPGETNSDSEDASGGRNAGRAKGPKPKAAAADSPTPVASNSGVPALTLASDLETLGVVTDAEMDALTFSVSASNTSVGTVVIAADGTFTYDPPAGCTGTDTFKYDVTDGFTSVPGEVTVSFVGCIWYVDNSHTPGGDGTAFDPFNKLSDGAGDANPDDGEDASGNHQDIFVFAGSGTTGQDAGISLNNAQRLIGNGVALTFPGIFLDTTVNSIAGPHTLFAAGTQPTIKGASPGVTVGTNSLGVSAVISGLDITAGTLGGSGDNGVQVDCGNFGAIRIVEISNNTIAGVQRGIVVSNAGCIYELDISNNHITATGAGIDNAGILVAGAGNETFITKFDSNTVDGSATTGVLGTGIFIIAATFDANLTLPDFQAVTGGTTTIGVSTSNRVGENGLVLGIAGGNEVSGSLEFTDLDIFATGTGLAVVGSGGFGLTVPAGSSVDAIGAALVMDPMTATMNLTANGTVVSLTDVSGAVNITGGTLSGGSTPTVEISGGAADVDIGASVIAGSALAVSISSLLTTADIDFNSTVTSNGATGGGISVTNGAGTNSVTFNGNVDLGQTTALNAIGLTMTGNSAGTTVAFGDLDITTSNADGIFGTTDGTLTTAAGSTVDTTNGTAIDITGLDFGGASLNFSNVDQTGSGDGINLAMITGTVNLGAVTINAVDTGLFASAAGTATVNSTSGTIAAGDVGISAMGPTMILGLTLTSMGVTGGTHGIFLDDTAGSLVVGAGATITGTSVAGVEIDGSTGTVMIGSAISTSSGRPVIVENLVGTDIDFTGTVTASAGSGILIQNNNLAGAKTIDFTAQTTLSTVANDGVELINNGTATITFSGGLDITTTSGRGIDATAGAAGINVTGAGNTVLTTTGRAVDIQNSTIGALGITFQSVTAGTNSTTGPDIGIVLNNTGSTGLFEVSGTGTTDASGGTIQGTSGDGIDLNTVTGVTFKNMVIGDGTATLGQAPDSTTFIGDNGIDATTVTNLTLNNVKIARTEVQGVDGIGVNGFTMINSEILNAGDGNEENGLDFGEATGSLTGLLGTALIRGSVIDGMNETGMEVRNFSGSLNLTIDDTRFSNNQAAVGNTGEQGILLSPEGTASMTVLVTGTSGSSSCLFDTIESNGITATPIATSTLNLTVENCTFNDNNAGDGGVLFNIDGSANGNVTVQDSIFTNISTGVFLKNDSNATMRGIIQGNLITSDGASGRGIAVVHDETGSAGANGTSIVLIGGASNSNTVTGTRLEGIHAFANEMPQTGASPDLSVTIRNNNVGAPTDTSGNFFGSNGIQVDSLNSPRICADIANNTSAGQGANAGIAVVESGSTVFQIEGLGSPMNAANTAAFLAGQNTSTAVAFSQGGGNFDNAASCPEPAATTLPPAIP